MQQTVTLGGREYPIVLPSLSVRRDVAFAFENERRAQLAALGICVELPRRPSDPLLGPAGWRSHKGSVYDFAETVESVLEGVGIDAWEAYRAGARCWTACREGAMPSLVEAVSRVDFGSAEAEKTGSPSSSDSGTAAIPGGTTG